MTANYPSGTTDCVASTTKIDIHFPRVLFSQSQIQIQYCWFKYPPAITPSPPAPLRSKTLHRPVISRVHPVPKLRAVSVNEHNNEISTVSFVTSAIPIGSLTLSRDNPLSRQPNRKLHTADDGSNAQIDRNVNDTNELYVNCAREHVSGINSK